MRLVSMRRTATSCRPHSSANSGLTSAAARRPCRWRHVALAAAGDRGAQVGDEGLGVPGVVLGRIQRAGGRVGEPAVDEAGARPGAGRGRSRAAPAASGFCTRTTCRSVITRAGVPTSRSSRSSMPGADVRRGASGRRAAGGRRAGRGGRARPESGAAPGRWRRASARRAARRAALQLDVVVDGGSGQLRHLVAAQPGDPAAGAGGQADVAAGGSGRAGISGSRRVR